MNHKRASRNPAEPATWCDPNIRTFTHAEFEIWKARALKAEAEVERLRLHQAQLDWLRADAIGTPAMED